jgi:hypothetical protein
VQFRAAQREQLSRTWNDQSWFFRSLGEPARDIVAQAYGVKPCTAREKSKSQEYLTLAASVFARKIGAEKSHVVHALLSGSVEHLCEAIGRRAKAAGVDFIDADRADDQLREAWEASFREVVID